MGSKSVKKNFFYNSIYQVFVLVLPIITTPYLSRVLGPSNIGIYSFTVTIVTYFSLFGTLGVSLYGQREIAYVCENTKQRKQVFWEIIFFRFLTMAISIAIYFYSYMKGEQYQEYYRILFFYLLASVFDISWFFQGMEDFKKMVVRNVVIRTISVICIFIFVRTQEDLAKYLIIYALADLLGNISLWFYLPYYFKGVRIKKISMMRHALPIILLFIPQIAMKVYHMIDKTMLGYMILDKSVLGNYEEANKVINVLFTIVSSVGIVMIPRIASIYASGEKNKINDYLLKSFQVTFFMAFPMTFGIILVANEFAPIFLGENFTQAALLIQIMAPVILGSGISNVIGMQYLLPTRRQKEYTISVFIGLILNIGFNFCLIPILGGMGAAAATVVAHLIFVLVQMWFVRKEIPIKKALLMGKSYGIATCIMCSFCIIAGLLVPKGIFSLFTKIILGGVTYLVCLILQRDPYIYEVRDMIRKRYKKRSYQEGR